MQAWAHGYHTEIPYTFGFYRETSPFWIRWGTFLGGRVPPRNSNLRVLELGCGQGFGLAILASLFPNIEFVGIDINPAHIAHARELASYANLTNLSFIEADFVELADNYPSELGEFHYGIMHGIWAWISKFVREKTIKLLKRAILPGGVVYVSYNAMPGWLSGTPLRELFKNYYKMKNLPAIEAVNQALELTKSLLEVNALVFNAFPGLKNRVETILKHDRRYIAHEFLNEAHEVLWVHEVVQEFMEGKFYYAGSANLIENFLPRLLPAPMEKIVNQYTHPLFRLFLIDLLINQAFRRDLYQKGVILPFGIEHVEEIKKTKFILINEPDWKEGEEYKFQTIAGQIQGRKEIYEPILEFFSTREPKSLEEVLELPQLKAQGVQLPGVVQAITLFLDKGILGFYNEGVNLKYTYEFNKKVAELVSQGRPYNFISAPLAGSALPLNIIEMLIFHYLSQGVRELPKLRDLIDQNLKQLGRQIVKEGKVIENPEEAKNFLEESLKDFLTKKLPLFKALGIVS